MSIKKNIFNLVKTFYISLAKVFPGYLGKRFRAESAESLVVIDKKATKYGELKYYCFGWLPLWRSQTLFIKEPEMIEWIDSMGENETLWDVGANVGLYSVYAGLKGMKVFAFEPSALNTFLLSKNIELNNLTNSVSLFPVAVSDKQEFGFLNMTSTSLGGALNEFNQSDIKVVGEGSYQEDVVFKQGMFSFSIDDLVEKFEFDIPEYIKIDVDSIEDRILYGATNTLSNEKVKGIFVELDENDKRTEELIYFLSEKGLFLKEKRQSEYFSDSKFRSQFNYIFGRNK